jgi:hypothetical protein
VRELWRRVRVEEGEVRMKVDEVEVGEVEVDEEEVGGRRKE